MPFLAAAAVIAASYGSGMILTRGARAIDDGLLRRLTIFIAGYALLALLGFLLGYVDAFERPVLIAVALACAALALPFVPRELRAARAAWHERCAPAWPLVAAAVVFLLGVFLASAPPTSGDAIAYHLSAPKEWLQAGHFWPIWWDWNTFQPFSTEMHQAYGLALWNGRAAMVVTSYLGGFSAACVFGLARELAGSRAAAIAALVWVAQGMFLWEATGGFVELALAGFVAVALWHVLALRRTGNLWHAAGAGLALGLAAGTKYHGLVFVPVLAVLAVVLAPRRRAVVFGILAAGALVGLPWYVRNWVVAGNPLYPFAAGLFGGRYLDFGARYDLSQSLGGFGIPGIWRLPIFPIEFLLHTDRYERGYSYSPALFALPPLAIAFGRRWTRWLGLALLAYLVVWWEAMHQVTRYLLPVLPLAAVLAGCAALELWERRGLARALVGAIAFASLVPLVAIAGLFTWRLGPGAVGAESQAAFVQRQTGTYRAFGWLDRNLPPGGRVLVGIRDAYYLERPYAVYDVPLFSYEQKTPDTVARMRRYDIRYLAFVNGALPTPLQPIERQFRPLAKLDVPFVTSRALGRVEHQELTVWAWCPARGNPCRL